MAEWLRSLRPVSVEVYMPFVTKIRRGDWKGVFEAFNFVISKGLL